MADRFFADGPIAIGDLRLRGPEAHHMVHVRRFAAGDRVLLFNGDGREYRAEIVETGKKEVLLRIDGSDEPRREAAAKFHIGSAIPKGDRADFLIEKLTELGVSEFTPLLCIRSVVQPKPQVIEKFERAVIEASKQCGRNVLMRIHPAQRLEDWVASVDAEQKWILHPGGASLLAEFTSVAAAIGPEGGFTEQEVERALACGFNAVSMGPRILRIETAALAIAARCAIQ